MSIAESMTRFLGGVSAEPEQNAGNKDFLDGYALGMTDQYHGGFEPITEEWIKRGKPVISTKPFKEWKRGYWAARFHKIEGRTFAA